MKKYLPNFITLLNLFSGCIALVFVAENNFEFAFYFVSLGIFFDFFDGFFARLFKVSGALGVQLDSLADMVTSGVVPGFVMYKLLSLTDLYKEVVYLPFLGFIITLGACYRLAKFNIDSRQSDSFIGLPTPANSLFILSLPLIHFTEALQNSAVLLAITLISAYIMNAEIPLFSLKIKDFTFNKYKLQVFFLVSSLLLILFFGFLGVALVILFYVILSILLNFRSKERT